MRRCKDAFLSALACFHSFLHFTGLNIPIKLCFIKWRALINPIASDQSVFESSCVRSTAVRENVAHLRSANSFFVKRTKSTYFVSHLLEC
jgi:hypothetical protein